MRKQIFNINPDYGKKSTEELIELLGSSSSFMRSNALIALSTRIEERNVLEVITDSILDPDNFSFRVMGIITVSMVGIIALLEQASQEAKMRAKGAMMVLPEMEKNDLIKYLEDEGIKLED